MDKKWLIGGLTLPALGLLVYGVVLGRAPELQGAVGPTGRSAEAGAFTDARDARTEDAVAAADPRDARAASSGRSADRAVHAEPRAGSSLFGVPAGHPFEVVSMQSRRLGGLGLPGEIDYRDPVEGGVVPLVPVWDRMDAAVSRHFRVRDFAARDGAPFARISPELVDFLDRLSDHVERPVHITSAYRHPALNFTARIDGAVESRHMAGLAADIWVEGKTPFELAEAALDVQDCRIGVGLGADYIHVDLRDYTSSWAYEGASMAEADFDLWMLDRCAGSFSEYARLLIERRACAEPLTGARAVEAYSAQMKSLARGHRERRMPGAVLLDVRSDTAALDTLSSRLEFLPVDSPLLRLMKLKRMIERAERNENFVFVVVDRDGAHRTGVMGYDDAPALEDGPDDAAACT